VLFPLALWLFGRFGLLVLAVLNAADETTVVAANQVAEGEEAGDEQDDDNTNQFVRDHPKTNGVSQCLFVVAVGAVGDGELGMV